jgi:serine/threonine-protein kinase HipA
LALEEDDEELALTLNGRKKKLRAADFTTAMKGAGMDDKVIENLFEKYTGLVPEWHAFINQSFLPEEVREDYIELSNTRLQQLMS